MENITVDQLKQKCKKLNISLTKWDGTRKLKKDLIRSLISNLQTSQTAGKRKSRRKQSKKLSRKKSSRRRRSKKLSRKRSSRRQKSKIGGSKKKNSPYKSVSRGRSRRSRISKSNVCNMKGGMSVFRGGAAAPAGAPAAAAPAAAKTAGKEVDRKTNEQAAVDAASQPKNYANMWKKAGRKARKVEARKKKEQAAVAAVDAAAAAEDAKVTMNKAFEDVVVAKKAKEMLEKELAAKEKEVNDLENDLKAAKDKSDASTLALADMMHKSGSIQWLHQDEQREKDLTAHILADGLAEKLPELKEDIIRMKETLELKVQSLSEAKEALNALKPVNVKTWYNLTWKNPTKFFNTKGKPCDCNN